MSGFFLFITFGGRDKPSVGKNKFSSKKIIEEKVKNDKIDEMIEGITKGNNDAESLKPEYQQKSVKPAISV